MYSLIEWTSCPTCALARLRGRIRKSEYFDLLSVEGSTRSREKMYWKR